MHCPAGNVAGASTAPLNIAYFTYDEDGSRTSSVGVGNSPRNSDDSSLTTNVFTLDPRLVGRSITKRF